MTALLDKLDEEDRPWLERDSKLQRGLLRGRKKGLRGGRGEGEG